MYDVSDVGFVAGWSLFALFFFIKGIRTAVFQSFGSCPVSIVMLTKFDSKVMSFLPRLMIISLSH